MPVEYSWPMRWKTRSEPARSTCTSMPGILRSEQFGELFGHRDVGRRVEHHLAFSLGGRLELGRDLIGGRRLGQAAGRAPASPVAQERGR